MVRQGCDTVPRVASSLVSGYLVTMYAPTTETTITATGVA